MTSRSSLSRLHVANLLALFLPFALQAASDVTVSTGATSGGAFSGGSPNVFTPSAATSVANTGTIASSLNLGTPVTINTTSAFASAGNLTVANTVTKSSGTAAATLTLNAVANLTINAALSASTGTMPLALNAGTAISSTAAITTNGGDITINTAQPFSLGNSLNAGAGQVLLQTGSLESSAVRTVTASNVQVSSGAIWHQRGIVAGNLNVAGTLSAGTAASSLTVNGALTLQSIATTVVDLAGTGPGTTYDQIAVNGAVTLDGALRLNFLDDFEDEIITSNTFIILTGSSITGTFTGLPNNSRITLPDELGSVKITYTATTVTLSDWQPYIRELIWDSGDADAGTQVLSNTSTRAGRHYFHVNALATDIGAWKTRLTVATGEAHLYLRSGSIPQTIAQATHKSEHAGSDGLVLRSDQYSAGQDWYFMVNADVGAQWSIFTGRAWVQDLGTLGWTDTGIANGQYDIGESALPSGSGPVTLGPEGIRFFQTIVPTGTPAWSLWLNGDNTRDIAVRKNFVPFHTATTYYDRKQAGQMLAVPPYLQGVASTYFLSVTGNPGETVNLDSRIQEVSVIGFETTTPSTPVTAAPFRVYRVQVPFQQIAWDVAVTPSSGDANVCVRRDNVPAKFDNDGFSEVGGSATDSVTLVPDFLTDGTWFITVYGASPYTFTLRSGPPTITDLHFTDTKINDEPNRAGWRFYKLFNIPEQLGSLGWELNLANQIAGTEIAIRQNAVPSRWRSRTGGSTNVALSDRVDHFGTGGFLQRPGHQADIWYVGIYFPTQPLGAFTLTSSPITPTPMRFDPASASSDPTILPVAAQEPGRWKFARIDVPAGVEGWDVRLTGVSGPMPTMVVRRAELPESTTTTSLWTPSSATAWPNGNQWAAASGTGADWTTWTYDIGAPTNQSAPPRLVMGMGRPLEVGTYYVGVRNGSTTNATSYTLDTRGIGDGQTFPIAALNYQGGIASVSNLARREAQYFKVQIDANKPSWEVTLAPTAGEMLLVVRRETIPDFNALENGNALAASGDLEVQMKKDGPERYVMLPTSGNFLPAGDYFLAVVSEGVNPGTPANTIGTGSSSGTLTSVGPLPITPVPNDGTAVAVNLAGGQILAYSFQVVQPGTDSVEVRLDSRVENPWMSVVAGARPPTPPQNYSPAQGTFYGYDGGSGGIPDDSILTFANPVAGTWTVLVRASRAVASNTYPNASANLVVTALSRVPLNFDGGTSAVVNQPPNSWKYFEVQVPTGADGWDVRLTGVTGGTPTMVVRRDLLPNTTGGVPPGWTPSTSTTWPSGNQWTAAPGTGADWTGWQYDIGAPTNQQALPRLVMGRGRPLEVGHTYFVGVYNGSATTTTSYTVDSRGIGNGLSFPVTTLTYQGGVAAVSNLNRREAQYFKVQIDANKPSWEVTLTPTVGEMLLVVRRETIPDFNALENGNALAASGDLEVQMKKAGPERYVMLPASGDFLPTGDYFLAVVSEGVNPGTPANTIGTGSSSGTLTSVGPLPVTPIPNDGTAVPVSLAGGQILAYSFQVVQPGTDSVEVRLNDRVENPWMSVVAGARFPSPPLNYITNSGTSYGYDGGSGGTLDDSILTFANPAAGTWTVLVRGKPRGRLDNLPERLGESRGHRAKPYPAQFRRRDICRRQPAAQLLEVSSRCKFPSVPTAGTCD